MEEGLPGHTTNALAGATERTAGQLTELCFERCGVGMAACASVAHASIALILPMNSGLIAMSPTLRLVVPSR